MHTAAWRSLRFASIKPARIIAGRRYNPRHTRAFHTTPAPALDLFPWSSTPTTQEEEKTSSSKTQPSRDNAHPEAVSELSSETSLTQEVTSSAHDSVNGVEKERNSSPYGSGRRRAARHSRPKEIPPIRIPLDFMQANVRRHLVDETITRGTLELSKGEDFELPDEQEALSATGGEGGRPDETEDYETASAEPGYVLNRTQWDEILASISAGLILPPPEDSGAAAENFANQKSHLKLLCPIDGGIYFLDKVVEDAAARLQADVVKIDPQSIAEIAGDYIREGADATSNALWTLGYDTAEVYGRRDSAISPSEEEAEDGLSEEGEDGESSMNAPPRFSTSVMAIPASMFDSKNLPSQLRGRLRNMRGNMSNFQDAMQNAFGGLGKGTGKGIIQLPAQQPVQWNDIKLNAVLENMLEASIHKQQMADDQSQSNSSGQAAQDSSSEPTTAETQQKTVVILKDFKELRATQQGSKVIDKLIEIVQKRRNNGHPIMLVGTSSSSGMAQFSLNIVENLQSEDTESVFRTVVVAPDTNRGLYEEEDRRRVREINGRHIFSMMKRLQNRGSAGQDTTPHTFASQLHRLMKGTSRSTYLEDQVLSLDDVHRIVFSALGLGSVNSSFSPDDNLKPIHIDHAISLLERSDSHKTKWAQNEHDLQKPPKSSTGKLDTAGFDLRIKKMRKSCNTHEKKLLNGVVNPATISTTFSDVHAEPATIDALKMLTTLSLKRPDAFKYGVLAKDKLNGLLLYGPPGTGKTLLAKAVAHESGATMLEISGSDVYDMYVGEGEKNVRAVFSLAKKLAPCVVFIDEADAIFASRGSGTNRNSHRELINQFLREWDGMTETSAFIMVATNRPFDLDDAALRRLPRRLLVDLPSEKDRAAILRIHLKDEDLAADVDIPKLAADTPLYSGSDLKNLAVAAALTAVREETEEAQRYEAARSEQESPPLASDSSADATPDAAENAHEESLLVPFKYPEKRTLTAKHFEKAMEEISASVNEDMSSLGAIRKFDEKYGDRRGRKKKTAYGFSPVGSEEVATESAKVRV